LLKAKELPNNLFLIKYTIEEMKKININIIKSQKYTNLYKNSFSLKEKIRLNNNFNINDKLSNKKINNFWLWYIT